MLLISYATCSCLEQTACGWGVGAVVLLSSNRSVPCAQQPAHVGSAPEVLVCKEMAQALSCHAVHTLLVGVRMQWCLSIPASRQSMQLRQQGTRPGVPLAVVSLGWPLTTAAVQHAVDVESL